MPGQRADARRNYAHILGVAAREVAERGADASMEQIARTAGVGSATVRRHFPSRLALLEAVFEVRAEELCARARVLAESGDVRAALLTWLEEVTEFFCTARGLATAVAQEQPDLHEGGPRSCSVNLARAGDQLLRRAAEVAVVAPSLTAQGLLTLITGIALASEHHPDPAAEGQRLLALAVHGISPAH